MKYRYKFRIERLDKTGNWFGDWYMTTNKKEFERFVKKKLVFLE